MRGSPHDQWVAGYCQAITGIPVFRVAGASAKHPPESLRLPVHALRDMTADGIRAEAVILMLIGPLSLKLASTILLLYDGSYIIFSCSLISSLPTMHFVNMSFEIRLSPFGPEIL